jgi:hypothetical protein
MKKSSSVKGALAGAGFKMRREPPPNGRIANRRYLFKSGGCYDVQK